MKCGNESAGSPHPTAVRRAARELTSQHDDEPIVEAAGHAAWVRYPTGRRPLVACPNCTAKNRVRICAPGLVGRPSGVVGAGEIAAPRIGDNNLVRKKALIRNGHKNQTKNRQHNKIPNKKNIAASISPPDAALLVGG